MMNVLPFCYGCLVLWGMAYLAEIDFDMRIVNTLNAFIWFHFHVPDKERNDAEEFDQLMNLFPREAGFVEYRTGVSGTLERLDMRCEFPTHGDFESCYLLLMLSLCIGLWVMFIKKLLILITITLYCSLASIKSSVTWHKRIVLYLLKKNVDPGVFRSIKAKSDTIVEDDHLD